MMIEFFIMYLLFLIISFIHILIRKTKKDTRLMQMWNDFKKLDIFTKIIVSINFPIMYVFFLFYN